MKHIKVTRKLPCSCEAWPFCEHAVNASNGYPDGKVDGSTMPKFTKANREYVEDTNKKPTVH